MHAFGLCGYSDETREGREDAPDRPVESPPRGPMRQPSLGTHYRDFFFVFFVGRLVPAHLKLVALGPIIDRI